MFSQPGVRDLTNLRDLVEGGEKNFDEVISNNTFLYLWNIGQQTIVNYIMNTFDLVLSNAFYLKKKTAPLVTKRCIAILTSPGATPYSNLIKDTNFLPFLMELSQHILKFSVKTQSVYFSILRQVLGAKLYPRLANKAFLRSVIALLPINECYTYAIDLINSKEKETIKQLKKCGFIYLLVEEIATVNDEPAINSPNPMRLFIKSLSTTHVAEAQKALQRDNKAAEIIDNILEHPHPEGIEFLRYLIQLGTARLFNGWHFVIGNIRGRIPDIVNLLLNSPTFTQISEGCVSLLTSYITASKSLDDNTRKVFIRLSSDFFKYPTNSFLHIRYVKLLQAINRYKLLSAVLIKESNLYENILIAYKTRTTNLAAYYGQLRQVVHIITPKLQSLTDYNSSEWQSVVVGEVKKADKIESKSYGKPPNYILRIILLSLLIVLSQVLILYVLR